MVFSIVMVITMFMPFMAALIAHTSHINKWNKRCKINALAA